MYGPLLLSNLLANWRRAPSHLASAAEEEAEAMHSEEGYPLLLRVMVSRRKEHDDAKE